MVAEQDTYLTPNEVARLLLVAPVTVRQWAQKGLLVARTTAGGHRRFARQEVERFARERGMALADHQPSILVVDDDPQLNGYLVALLEASIEDIQVHSAQDGFVAGRLVQAHKPDTVLLDIMMPGLNGVDVCRAIKSDPATEDTLVVAMTGHHTPQLEREILEAGAVVLLKKPFTPDELFAHCGYSSLVSTTR